MTRPGLYIHVPFCRRKCAYCDFVSYPLDGAAVDEYVRAVTAEIARRGTAAGETLEAASLYVGGGTPTALPVEALTAVVETVRRHFRWPEGLEVTVEANPETAAFSVLDRLRRLGINRLSIGMQSGEDRLLAVLGRGHRAADVREAVRLARRAGFTNLNLDLISGIPGQTPHAWRRTLEAALALEPEHISAYGLEVLPGTALHARLQNGALAPVSEDQVLEMFHLTREVLTGAGYEHYEIANYARPGRECRHNLIYWRNEPYLGFGPAAHSFWNGRRTANEKEPPAYAARLSAGELPVAESETPDARNEMAETMFLGLRLLRGVERARFERRFGRDPEAVYGPEIAWLHARGLLAVEPDRLRLTAGGLALANLVFERFL
ncbi:MAG: radical SAM family heme chaperone HemW [Bacillota bacterium]